MKHSVKTVFALAALLLCASAYAHRITPAHSGSWFDPDFDKQGFVLEVLGKANDQGPERTVLVYWFTFDNDGNPIWLAGVGDTEKNRLTVTVQRTSGGARPPGMVIAASMQDWATVTFEFNNCKGATADFEILDDGSTGTYNLMRLTKIGDSDCKDDNDDEDGPDDENEVKVAVDLIPSAGFEDARGEAAFKMEEDEASFKVEIKNLEPGEYTLFVGGVERGTIVVKPHGENGQSTRGKISFSDEGEDDGHPLDFDPRGMAIEVANGDGVIVLSADFPE